VDFGTVLLAECNKSLDTIHVRDKLTPMSDNYTTKEAAAELGISDSRVRQLLIASHENDKEPIGKSHGPNWLLTERDLNRLRNRKDKRFKDDN